jgi:hypothetical protein
MAWHRMHACMHECTHAAACQESAGYLHQLPGSGLRTAAAACLLRSCANTTLAAFNKTLTWVETSLWDSEFGEVYWQVDVPSGKVRRGLSVVHGCTGEVQQARHAQAALWPLPERPSSLPCPLPCSPPPVGPTAAALPLPPRSRARSGRPATTRQGPPPTWRHGSEHGRSSPALRAPPADERLTLDPGIKACTLVCLATQHRCARVCLW